MGEKYDFSGWATRNDLQCSDGRIIRQNAFADNDSKVVPLVWQHTYDGPENVLGHALLLNKPEGVYTFGKFNDTESGQNAKKLVDNGDIVSLSIHARQLKQQANNVIHGDIKEVSLVIAGANPGAFIDNVYFTHSDGGSEKLEDEAIIYFDQGIELLESEVSHADKEDEKEKDTEKKEEKKESPKEEKMADKGKTSEEEIFESFTEEQKELVYMLIAAAKEDAKGNKDDEEEDVKHSDEGGYDDMKYNAFDSNSEMQGTVLTHADEQSIIQMAKSNTVGSFRAAIERFADENSLSHDDLEIAPVGGFAQEGTGNVTELFPEYKEVRPGAPELITNDQGWIGTVMNKVHKSPISRIRTSHVDIRNIDALRAKGYVKGTKKALTGNMRLVRRTTDPQTIYVKNALHRDDIVDITDFDVVQYMYNIDRMMLNEELATAIMLGDSRDEGDPDKISEEHIRPIWLDDDLYTIHRDLDLAAATEELQGTETDSYFGENYITAEAMVNAVLYAREDYKGSGTPDMYITPHMLNVMLLARDRNGRRIYNSKNDLAAAFNVGNIFTAEQFAGKTRTYTDSETNTSKTKKLHAIICNIADYSLGSTKGGEVTHFTQFDIDFNQEKSLLETRVSGALTRVYSAIAIEEEVTE